MMNELFKDMIDENEIIVYMDNIFVYAGHDMKEQSEIIRKVLKICHYNDLYLKYEKCDWFETEIKALGMIVTVDGVKMDLEKLTGIAEWPVPKNVTDVQSFLGMCNYHRRFIEGFSNIANALHTILKKGFVWNWSKESNDAFLKLKEAFVTNPILVFPDPKKKMRIEADLSGFATGSILSVYMDDEKWHPCCYLSKGLSAPERNYDIHDREMLLIMRLLESWRHYLEGADYQIEILSDHKNLEYFMMAQKLTQRQAQWALFLSRFDFVLKHRPGRNSGKPDLLSRRSDHKKGENDNSGETLLKPDYFKIRATCQGHVLINGEENDMLAEIRKMKEYDEAVVKAIEELKRSPTRHLREEEWSEEQGLILFRGKVYVPNSVELQRKIIKLHHNSLIAGHPGRWKTHELVSHNYWWPNMTKFITSYIAGCDLCKQTKTYPAPPRGKLIPNVIPENSRLWEHVSTDMIVKLPERQGYDLILVILCHMTKQAHFIPMNKALSSLGLTKLYRDNVWKLHGLPLTIILDRGPQFASSLMKDLNKMIGIKTKLSTAHHLQTDGQTERVNQEIEQYLRLFISHHQDDWVDLLSTGEFSYNNKISASTQMTPFRANIGFDPRMGIEPTRLSKNLAAEDFVKKMEKTHEETKSALVKAHDKMKRFADQNRGTAPVYAVGDKVWLSTENLAIDQPSRKLGHKRIGPYSVTKIVNPNAVKLRLPSLIRIHPVVNTSWLMLFTEATIPGQKPKPAPPVQVKSHEEHEVESILAAKLVRGKLQYLVHWKGYTPEHDTWEPKSNLGNAKEFIKEFYKAHPSAPRRLNASIFNSHVWKTLEPVTDVNETIAHMNDYAPGFRSKPYSRYGDTDEDE